MRDTLPGHAYEPVVLAPSAHCCAGQVRCSPTSAGDLLVKYDHRSILRMLLSAGFDLVEVRGFRSSKGWLAPVPESAVDRVADQSTWSPIDLYYMKFFYARRRAED